MKNSALLFLISAGIACGQTINGPIPITHEVFVNPVRSENTSGTKANYLGTPAQETAILAKVNEIWAQLGVRINWGNVRSWSNNFVYDGSNTNPRPTSHLNQIIDRPDFPRKPTIDGMVDSPLVNPSFPLRPLDPNNPDDRLLKPNRRIMDIVFVRTSPGPPTPGANNFNGLGFVDGNGITIAIGDNILPGLNATTAVATVIAHEIGHNLGLAPNHLDLRDPDNPRFWTQNLMNGGADTLQLIPYQRERILTDDPNFDGFSMLYTIPEQTNFDQFLASNNLNDGAAGDQDGDGLNNLLEFALNLDPLTNSQIPPLSEQSLTEIRWAIPKNPAAVDDGITYSMTVSSDLQSWNPVGQAGTGTSFVTNNDTSLVARVQNRDQAFFVLEVAQPAATMATLRSLPETSEAAAFQPPAERKLCSGGCCFSH